MELREKLARCITVADGVDPDVKGCGLGVLMPKDSEYPLWEARLHIVDALLKEFEVNDKRLT